jgi:Ti-type conjugative transfer relaxase TraA
MLSIGKLGHGSEEYYLDQVATPEDYYLGAGEAPGRWLGSGAATLGLSGEVSREDLSAVLGARSPIDGSSLTGRVVSPSRHVPGFDLTFSAPKSLSLLYGLASPEVSEAVRVSHDEAVADSLAYLEAHAAFTRRGTDGVQRIATSGLVAAAFRQRTSRNGDPQLHTHVLVANVVRGTDGRWSSLHASLVYHQSRTAGFVYQAALRAGLVWRLGVRFQPPVNGMSEIAGIPPELLKTFSTRRAEVKADLAEFGASTAKAAEIAALKTRKPKQHLGSGDVPLPLVGLQDRWRGEARSKGFDPDVLESALGRPRRPMVSADHLASLAEQMLGAEGLTHHASSFERRDVVRSLAEGLADGARLPGLEAGADAVIADARIVHLGTEGRAGEEKVTTAEMLAVEAGLLAEAEGARTVGAGLVDPSVVDVVLGERPTIAAEQADMVRRLTTSGAGVEVVIGKAGAGKTYALDAARAAWQQGGLAVQGAALAARAAAELESGAGIASTTLARLFIALERGDIVLGRRDVLVVDEAGMVGSRALGRLIDASVAAGCKLVLVGDPHQLPEIQAGGALRMLAERLGASELTENRRQEADWERAALDELRHGEVGAGIVAYGENGKLHLHDSARSARVAMVTEWADCRSQGVDARMYALRRSDVEDLNALARVELRRRGELGPDLCVAGDRSYAADDEVLFCRNDRDLDVLNGTRGKVLDSDGSSLRVETDRGIREVPSEYLEAGHLDHGFASTVHKSQGATVGRAFVLGGDAMYREAGYVAMSRAKSGTDMFVATSAFDDGRGTEIEEDGVHAGLVRALSASRAKQLAVESLDPDRQRELLAEAQFIWSRLEGHEEPHKGAPRRIDETDGVASPGAAEAARERLELIEAAGAIRRRLLGERAAVERPAEIVGAIGEPPASGPGRHTWMELAGAFTDPGHVGDAGAAAVPGWSLRLGEQQAPVIADREPGPAGVDIGEAPASGAGRLAWMRLAGALADDGADLGEEPERVVRSRGGIGHEPSAGLQR